MVASVLGLDAPPSPPDAADALALAVCQGTAMACAAPWRCRLSDWGVDRDRIARGTFTARPADSEVMVDVGGVGWLPADGVGADRGVARFGRYRCVPVRPHPCP